MTDKESMKLALEALEGIHPGNMTPMAEEYWNKAIAALKERLAQPEQEPVAWMREDGTLRFADGKMFAVGQPFYTHPPQRTWVGLTDLQKGVIKFNHSKVGMMLMTEYDLDAMLEATEQALKEKNT